MIGNTKPNLSVEVEEAKLIAKQKKAIRSLSIWLGVITVCIAVLLYFAFQGGFAGIPILSNIVSAISGPNDTESLRILQQSNGSLMGDFHITGKNQCPISQQQRANGLTDSYVVFYTFSSGAIQNAPASMNLIKTQQNPIWVYNPWQTQC